MGCTLKLIIDAETNGLLHEYQTRELEGAKVASVVHCLCAIDVDSGLETKWVGKSEIEEALVLLGLEAQRQEVTLIGHDLQAFDLPILEKLFGFRYSGRVFDTKIAARCIYPDTKTDDWRSKITGKPWAEVPSALNGSHTLKAWGIRLGVHKGDREKQDFTQYSPEMLEYCMRDCQVTLALYKNLISQKPSERMLQLEHEFSKIIDQQKLNGFTFNIKGAEELTAKLQGERIRLEDELKNLFPPRLVEFETPKKRLKRTKTIIFNPASRDHISWNLINKYGWKPEKFCEKTGKPQVDEDVLSQLDYPESKRLTEYLTLQKRLGQISEGKQAWLKLVQPDGRVHGGVNTNGTVTGRCSHVAPNMGQVPRVGNPYGQECRALFTSDAGWTLIGCDASGIQLRALGHYLAKYDQGEYAKIVTEGDPHERNREATGLATRDEAKTFIYAFLFGAGSAKIGKILGKTPDEGKSYIRKFLRNIPAIKKLRDDIGIVIRKRGTLFGLDGRNYPIRSEHVGLNVLLMGFEAVIMKQATINLHNTLQGKGMVHGKDYKQVVHVHDEFQFTAPGSHSGVIGLAAEQAIQEAGVRFGSRCPLAGKHKVGFTWADTH